MHYTYTFIWCSGRNETKMQRAPQALDRTNWHNAAAIWTLIKAKGRGYWTRAAIVLAVSVYASHYVYENLNFRSISVSLFQEVTELLPRQSVPRFTGLVVIQDEEYWAELGGRRPIKRDYLARIVNALVEANAHVIALDFDMRLPDAHTGTIPAEYMAETKQLIDAIKNAAIKRKKIVLSTPLSLKDGEYYRDLDVYQVMGLCARQAPDSAATKPPAGSDEDKIARNVTCGYIGLPYDFLAIPGRLPIVGEPALDSFALAIARARNPSLIRRLEASQRIGETDRYGSFISDKKFRNNDTMMRANELLGGSPRADIFEANAVLVGGEWSSQAAGRGPLIDLHNSPVGFIPGLFLHANFVEAILDDRTFAPAPGWALHAIEVVFGIISGGVFAVLFHARAKMAGFMILVLTAFFAQWVLLHQLGMYFDALFPVAGLAIHSICERLFERKAEESGG